MSTDAITGAWDSRLPSTASAAAMRRLRPRWRDDGHVASSAAGHDPWWQRDDQLAALMTQCDEQSQMNNTTMENAANKAAEQEDSSRVAAMRDKANQDFTGALVSGLSDVVAGGLAIGGAVVTGGPGTSGTPAADAGRGWSGTLNGGSKMFGSSGVGSILSAGYKAGADNDDANAAQHESASDADVRAYNAAASQVQAAADALSKIEDTISGILQTQAQTGAKVAGG